MTPGQSAMYILPLSSMHDQYRTRLQARNISCEEWTYRTSASNPPRVIVVTAEKTNDGALRSYTKRLVKSGKLSRIIVDEAHIYLTHEDFRECMQDMVWVGQLGVQVVLQTATASNAMVPLLFRKFGITVYTICRGSTIRSNISLNSTIVDDELSVKKEVILRYQVARKANPRGVILIFCRTQSDADDLSSELVIGRYHAGMSIEERDLVMDGLKTSSILAVACTSLLGVALDLGDVVCGIHYGYPRNMVDFAQEIGRLARAPGCMAESWVVAWKHFQERYPEVDIFGAEHARRAVDQQSSCRQKPFGDFFDGMSLPCGMHGKVANTCDNCKGVHGTAAGECYVFYNNYFINTEL